MPARRRATQTAVIAVVTTASIAVISEVVM